MNERLPLELQDLHAYVDNELGPAERRAVEARLEQDPRARDQVASYRRLQRELHRGFDPVLAEPIPPSMRRPHRGWAFSPKLRALAASLLLLLGGGWIGMQLQQHELIGAAPAVHVVQDAVAAFAVYTPEVLHPVEVRADQAGHLATWLSKRLAAKVQLPDLAAYGFALLGGRLLATEDGPGALLMYEANDGRRLVLYLCENDLDGQSTSMRFVRDENRSVYYWFEGPFSFALVAGLNRSDLSAIAETVYLTYQG